MSKRNAIYEQIQSKSTAGIKQLAILVDPDKVTADGLMHVIDLAVQVEVDYFFAGGSLMNSDQLSLVISTIKSNCHIPVVLFPGSPLQISKDADALLFLSLISGRNADLLIGSHVISAPYVKAAELEVLATGYMLVDCGKPTTASYISNTAPIPYDKADIAACTALAGEYLGLRLIYIDGGSGASKPLSAEMITAVKKSISLPLIAGGGIRSAREAENAYRAGADVLVVGNAFEQQPERITSIAAARKTFTTSGISSSF